MINQDIVSDLDVLDYLEIFRSTVKAAEFLDVSQSSCSRRYRAASEALALGFDRHDTGYGACLNHDVLAALRGASQKLRVRRGGLRVAPGWYANDLVLPAGIKQMPVLTMSTADTISLLDGRLLDIWIGGLMELQPLLAAPPGGAVSGLLELGSTLMALPLLRWPLLLVAHRNHPLRSRAQITPEDLKGFPSPALPMGAAPLLNCRLQSHGLATIPYGRPDYDLQRWEAIASDGCSLAYAPPHRLELLRKRFQLEPLPFQLNIEETLALVGHRDVMADPQFPPSCTAIRQCLRESPLGSCDQITWLP